MLTHLKFPYKSKLKKLIKTTISTLSMYHPLIILLISPFMHQTPFKVPEKSGNLIFGRNGCSYCDKAIDLMKSHNLEFTYLPLEKWPDARDFIVRVYRHRTVPCIFLGDEFVGGYSELNRKLNRNKC